MTLSRFRFRSAVDPMENSFFAHLSSSADIGLMCRQGPTVAVVARFNPL
jgi:hypothetical protein